MTMMPTQMVSQPLTEEELDERGSRLAALIHQLAVLEVEKKDNASVYAKKIKMKSRDIQQTAQEIRERCKYVEAQMTIEDELGKRRREVGGE